MIDSHFTYADVYTETQLCDLCVKTYKRDLRKLRTALNSAEAYYSNNSSKDDVDRILDPAEGRKTNNFNTFGTLEHESISEKKPNRGNKRISRNLGNGKGFSKLREVGPTDNENIRKLSSDKESQVSKSFKRPTNIGLPFMYNDLDTYFTSRCGNNLPIFGPAIGRDEVRTLDQEAVKRYTSVEKDISENMQYFLLGSILNSFRILGITTENERSGLFTPLSIRQSVHELVKNTNAGYPSFKRKNDKETIHNTIEWLKTFLRKPTFYRLRNRFLKECHTYTESAFNELMKLPVHIMHRFQIRAEEDYGNKFVEKCRQVWCVPFSVVALECMFFKPILDKAKSVALKRDEPVFPMGLNNRQLTENVCLPLQRRKRRFLQRKLKSFDFSKFDSTIEAVFTSFIFTLLGKRIHFTPRRLAAYECLRYYTCFTPFIYDNKIYLTRKGVCSGSYTTNFRDTIVNLSMIICAIRIKYSNLDLRDKILNGFLHKLEHTNVNFRYEIRKNYHYVDFRGFHVYGDDGIGLESDDFFILHRFICMEYHLTIKYKDHGNEENNSFFFLGRFWNKDGKPWQTYEYIIAHIKYRTKFYDKESVPFDISEKLELYRVLSIALPLLNGRQFLDEILYDWPPYMQFLKEDKGFYLLKEWPHDEYQFISRDNAFKLSRY